MKFTTSKKLDQSLLGKRSIGKYSYTSFVGDSNDGMRRGYSYTANCTVYGTIENETQNPDGTYTYDYSSRVVGDDGSGGPREPEKSKYDLENMIEELLFKYNIHEFSTDLQEGPISVKDYYVYINADSRYKNGNETNFFYRWEFHEKEKENTNANAEYNKNISWSPICERIRGKSIDEVNEKLNSTFSKEDYILYLMGHEVEKKYGISLDLDDIGDDETIKDFLAKIKLESPRYSTFEEAMENGEITESDIEQFINDYKNINGKKLPHDVIESILKKNPELVKKFSQSYLPVDLLKKYYPDFDIMSISPAELDLEDLDAVLEGFKKNYLLDDECKQYMSYLIKFYDDPEKVKKILSSIDSSQILNDTIKSPPFSVEETQQFIENIPEEIMSSEDIRNCILENDSILVDRILSHNFEYDESSALKLLKHLGDFPGRLILPQVNTVIEIAQQN